MIKYTPKLGSFLWEHKTQHLFESIEDLKRCIAYQETMFCHYIGHAKVFHPEDVKIRPCEDKVLLGLENCRHVILGGCIVGYCGE